MKNPDLRPVYKRAEPTTNAEPDNHDRFVCAAGFITVIAAPAMAR